MGTKTYASFFNPFLLDYADAILTFFSNLKFFSLEPPRFVKKLSDTSTLIGDPVELRAVVEGFQPISVTWLKDKGEVIRESENIRISFSDNIATLQLGSPEASNSGKYVCQIKNDAGMRECSAVLTVLG
jgi:titin